MQRSRARFASMSCIVAVVGVLGVCHIAQAGSNGTINGRGIGYVWSSVTASTGNSNMVITVTNLLNPSASITNALKTAGYATNGSLPAGALTSSFSQIKTAAGGVFIKGKSVDGDGTDNPELEKEAIITPADCSSITIGSQIDQSQDQFNANGNSGTITVNGNASGGAAVWLRGWEYDGPMSDIPICDPFNPTNASVEFLKQHGVLKYNTLLVGPFDYGDPNNPNSSCPLVIPFSLNSSNLENLVMITETVTKSYPLTIQCPADVTVKCSDPITYPPVSYGGCGAVTITFNPAPPASGTFPPGSFQIGTTPVTVTLTDSVGNTTNCTFTVTVVGNPPVPPALPTLTGETSVTVPPSPQGSEICGGTTTPVNGTTSDSLFYNTQGTFTVHWTFDDGRGDVIESNQTVIVHDDIPPVPPKIPVVTGECSATISTAPIATDNVMGPVTGVPPSPLPLTFTTQGTNYVIWTFTDENNNTSTATQTVIIHDDIPPAIPPLPDLTYNSCAGGPVTPPTPTTTDNCSSTVYVSSKTPFPITTPGTNVVTWIFSDGNGNTNTATQNIILTGLTFTGFSSPVGGIGGSCLAPFLTNNVGSTVPIKFLMYCGSTQITSGTPPTVQIQAYGKDCTPSGQPLIEPTAYQNDWHYNWVTKGFQKGVYGVTVSLPDGSKPYFFIRLD